MDFLSGFCRGTRPDPATTVTAWANAYRVLTSAESGTPGRWATARVPYLKEVMDCLSPSHRCSEVYMMCGAQLGKSEAALNTLGAHMHLWPCPIMLVQPTLDTAKFFSTQRVSNLIQATPVLNGLVPQARSKDGGNAVLVKEFPGGVLRIIGAESATGLRSMPVRVLVMDEVDAFPLDAGGEGDPVNLAIQRTATFPNRKIFGLSTPTVKGKSRIARAFRRGDQRYYHVPCPHCEAFQKLRWAQVKWPDGRRDLAFYECEVCGGRIQEHHKTRMLAAGEWVAENPDSPVVSFHLSGLYSPLGWNTTWASIAIEHGDAGRDPRLLKTWANLKLGEEWEEEGEEQHASTIAERRESYTAASLPAGVVRLTAGVDTQVDRLEMTVVGWGFDEEAWVVSHEIFYGDPSSPGAQGVWGDLDAALRRVYPSASGRELPISASCIDTGGHHTKAVYTFCATRHARRIWAVKGSSTPAAPPWPRKPTKRLNGGVNLYLVGVTGLKEASFSRFNSPRTHYSADLPPAYFDQLVAERKQETWVKGVRRVVWVLPEGRRNEAFDCFNYASAALWGLYSSGVRLNAEAERERTVEEALEERRPPPAPRRVPKAVVKRGWV